MRLRIKRCLGASVALIMVAWLALPAQAGVVHVKADAADGGDGASWETAFSSLQDALASVSAGDEIWVAQGVYRPDIGMAQSAGDRAAWFNLIDGISLYGGFDGTELSRDDRAGLFAETILSGDLAGDDGPAFENNSENSYGIVRADLPGSGSVVMDGFTCAHANSWGGVLASGKGLVVRNCTFRQNESLQGAAISSFGGATFVRVEDCVFFQNRAACGGAISVTSSATVSISNCSFRDNQGEFGGALYLNGRSGTVIDNCDFAGNSALFTGGAIRTLNSSEPMIRNCKFVGNRAQGEDAAYGGGAIASRASAGVDVVNCMFTGNLSTGAGKWDGGGAILVTQGRARIRNSTFSRNKADARGGAVMVFFGSARLFNCVLWENEAIQSEAEGHQVDSWGGVRFGVAYSCVQGLSPEFPGEGNIGSDPRLIDPIGPDNILGTLDDNVRLAGGSPCLDAGNNARYTDDPVDADGLPRFEDDPDAPDTGSGVAPLIDMGAFEGSHQAIIVSQTRISVDESDAASFGVTLAKPPAEPVTLDSVFVAGDADISVTGGASLMFDAGNYSTPQFVTFAAAEDADFTNGSATFSIDGATLHAGVEATEADNEPAPPIVYVKRGGTNLGYDWASAFDELRDAIDAAANRGGVSEIWVTAGTYAPAEANGDRFAAFRMLNGLAIRGGFVGTESSAADRDWNANETILTGDLNSDDEPVSVNTSENSYSVVTAELTDQTATLDGFIIRAGIASGWPSVTSAIGGDRKMSGGGVFALRGNPVVVNCRLIGNSAYWGGGFYGTGSVVNCVLNGNLAAVRRGGGGKFFGRSQIVNTTITNNNSGRGAAIWAEPAATIQNCVVWNNEDPNGMSEGAQINPEASPNYCLIQGWSGVLGGVGNFSDDPAFVDPIGADGIAGTQDDDLRLSISSPAIDAGCNWSMPADLADVNGDDNFRQFTPLDLEGQARFFDKPSMPDTGCGVPAIVDLGAYESGGTGPLPCFADLDNNGAVDLVDLTTMLTAFASVAGDPEYDCIADLTCDGQITLLDLTILLSEFAKICD